jgi:predicted Zn-dependent protease
MPATTEALEKLLASGRDNALLRFGLGSAYLQQNEHDAAIPHLQRAVAFDPNYSAAWKLLGKAYVSCGRNAEALEAYRSGMAAAQAKGDKQALKEMQVFARRIEKQLQGE